jgi:hypothetical protein
MFGIAPVQGRVAASHAIVIGTAKAGPVSIAGESLHEQGEREQKRWSPHGVFEMIHRDGRTFIVPAWYQDRLTGKYLVAYRATSQTQGKELSLNGAY